MKKRIVALLMCGVMIIGSTACGAKKEEPAPATPTAAPTVEAEPTVEPETPSENEVVEEEVEEEPEVVVIGEEDDVPEWVGTLTAPEGYEEETYGTAPLSSVYLLLAYSCKLDNAELADMELDGLEAKDFIEKLDTNFGIKDGKEETRKEYIATLLGLSGLTDGTDEQVEGFFDGSWVPDGTDYMADFRTEDGGWSINTGDDSFEREHAYDTKAMGEDFKLWVEVSSYGTDEEAKTASGAVTYVFYTVDGSKNTLSDKDFTAKYVGDLDMLTITGIETLAADAEDKIGIKINYEIDMTKATGDEVVFENDFELTDSKGNLVEKIFN